MPQTFLFFVKEDQQLLVRFLIEEGFSFIPDLRYESSSPIARRSLDAFEKYRLSCGRFFLTRTDFETFPLQLGQVDSCKFYIKQREGGPVLDLCFMNPYADDGRRRLGPGWISYYATYWKPGLKERVQAPVELKRAYSRILRFIKKNSVPTSAKGFLAGQYSVGEVSAGQLELHDALGGVIGLQR